MEMVSTAEELKNTTVTGWQLATCHQRFLTEVSVNGGVA